MELGIIGVDEAGRGPLAGPVVAGAVRIKSKEAKEELSKLGITDSKKISAKKRDLLFEVITKHNDVEWGSGVISREVIDEVNILEATKMAMKIAVEKIDSTNSLIIIDGNFKINVVGSQKSVVRADESILECSMASIIAKVVRDRMMQDYHNKYPEYGFDKHKGYGTKFHRDMIKVHNLSPIHRRSFTIK